MVVLQEKKQKIKLIEKETQILIDEIVKIEHSSITYFEKSQAIARKLGAHYRSDGLTEICLWTPELTGEVMRPRDTYLEVFTPVEKIDFQLKSQKIKFRRERVRLQQHGEYFCGVVSEMRSGKREQVGSFYWLRYIDPEMKLRVIRDVLAHSLPFGIFAPAELYDIDSLQANRADISYFQRTGVKETEEGKSIPRVNPPTNILQLHIGTASFEGTFAGLTRIFQTISDKLAKNEPLTPAESNFVGYDAVQLLPTEPSIEYRNDYSPISEFFLLTEEEPKVKNGQAIINFKTTEIEIDLRKPNTQDWGYDVPILGSAATNPALLGSLRPAEVWDFIATLHNFSTGPIQVIYDLVYGHADNQSELLINRQFMKGPNMYGQDLNHQLPNVRAILLEMQRRRLNKGADGIRVDGGQDFRFFNPLSGRVEQDDAYLLSMANIVQEIGGYKRLMFTIFEDGRPWPEEGWEETSTYRELIELMPESYQWGPLIFAHNTPALKGFWEKKWRRISEVMHMGENWITGCGNHDTLRRGNQIPMHEEINWSLGKNLPEVFDNAYDNPAVTLWVYGFTPGLPMDFINTTMRAPWMFFRNTDDRYGVKVISEEMGFLDWQISEDLYQKAFAFQRLKSLGFATLDELQEFGNSLVEAMLLSDYDLVKVLQSCLENAGEEFTVNKLKVSNNPQMVKFLKELDIPKLKIFALMFMEDGFDICNVWHYENLLSDAQTQFNLALRNFRHKYPWLTKNLAWIDRFNKISDRDRTVFYGIRHNPDNNDEKIAMIAHLEGEELTATLGDWLQLDLEEWEIAIASPGLEITDLNCFELKQSQGILLVNK
jgi:Hypothetical glycoside hydrolase 5